MEHEEGRPAAPSFVLQADLSTSNLADTVYSKQIHDMYGIIPEHQLRVLPRTKACRHETPPCAVPYNISSQQPRSRSIDRHLREPCESRIIPSRVTHSSRPPLTVTPTWSILQSVAARGSH